MTSGCCNLHADDIDLAHYIEEFKNFVHFKVGCSNELVLATYDLRRFLVIVFELTDEVVAKSSIKIFELHGFSLRIELLMSRSKSERISRCEMCTIFGGGWLVVSGKLGAVGERQ